MVDFRYYILLRPQLASTDSSIHPLSKSDWRDISSFADFKKLWPKSAAFPYSDDVYWRGGHEKMFSKRITEQIRAEPSLPVLAGPHTMECGCHASSIDWLQTEVKLKKAVVIGWAEVALMHDFALLDPDLMQDLDGYGHAVIPLLSDLPPHLASNNTVVRKRDLVQDIVWFRGPSAKRGWELEDLASRRDWVCLLARYLEPLWRASSKWATEEHAGGTVDDVTEAVVDSLEDMDQVQRREKSLLTFWMRYLQMEKGLMPTAFYSSPGISVEEYHCPMHRGRYYWS